ncbi:MAG: hypothetical protein PHH60_03540, partial [Candidatus Margulisbacteria bacterium]|nr:hypothetical protein [Candidatus Margulisiibacteriota bacterium]
VAPANVTVGINQSQTFTVTAKNSAGFIIQVNPTWSVSGGIGTISSSGLFVAGGTAGQGTVTATYGTKTASATVIITENGWIEGLVSSKLGATASKKVYLSEAPTLFDFTETDGSYSISNIPPGTYWVIIDADATFLAASQEVTVGRGQVVSGKDFYLETQPGIPDIPTTTLPEF